MHAETECLALTQSERKKAIEHVTTKDFPETLSRLSQMAEASGFTRNCSLYREKKDFYELILFEKS